MAFLRRLKFYLIGVGMGLLFVYFLFGNRTDIKCSYFPNARVLKNISEKELVLSELAACQFQCLNNDSAAINNLLYAGKVDFKKSDTKKTSCKTYFVSSQLNDKKYSALIENCDSTATVLEFTLPVTFSCVCE